MSEHKTKILVVDDDARLRELLNRYLGEQGYNVRAVANATDMNRQLARERYDLMILDLMHGYGRPGARLILHSDEGARTFVDGRLQPAPR